MKTYHEKNASKDNVELIQMSYDRTDAKALAWAKKESLPWPTILGETKKEGVGIPINTLWVNK